MPKVTIWIREGSDYDKWKAIKSKPEWLHHILNSATTDQEFIVSETVRASKGLLTDGTTAIGKFPDGSFGMKRSKLKNGLCKIHGTPLDDRGKCLQKGCKYA